MSALFILMSFLHLTTSYTVIPDEHNYPNTTCLHCHKLQYYLLNGTRYFISNTHLRFLSGLYYLNTDFIIENVNNISLIGRSINHGKTSTVIQCNSSVGIVMENITNLSIENMVIKNCGTLKTHSFSAAVIMTNCYAVKLYYMKICHVRSLTNHGHGISLLGINIMGSSYLEHITCDQQLRFLYLEANAALYDNMVSLSHYHIVSNFSAVGYAVYIELNQISYLLTFQISNTNLLNTFLYVKSKFSFQNVMVITNCSFNDYHYKNNRTLIYLTNLNVHFKNCQFMNIDSNANIIVMSNIKKVIVDVTFDQCIFHYNRIKKHSLMEVSYYSNITISHCSFYDNTAKIFSYSYNNLVIADDYCNMQPVAVIIKNTTFSAIKHINLLLIACTRLLLIGPVKFCGIGIGTINDVMQSIIILFRSTITINGYIEFSYNLIDSLIKYSECVTQDCFTMNVANNATLVITNNALGTYFHVEWNEDYTVTKINYPPCFFQYLDSSTIYTNYSIIFRRNTVHIHGSFLLLINKVLSSLQYVTEARLSITHCYWLPHSIFNTTIPLDVNDKYVKFANNSEYLPHKKRKLLCYCINDTHYDCYKDDLGYLYPGQTASIPFCWIENFTNINNIYAQVLVEKNTNQTHFTPCVVHQPNEIIQLASKKCTTLHYTIAFPTDNWCELFLKVPFGRRMEYNIFYIRQLSCPFGFVKKDGICQCYSSFSLFGITDCNINSQTILRPANSWISASNQNNYFISLICPFHYCKASAMYLNLAYPDMQCQFNRSGTLCGQCQQGLSTIFGSSHCKHCSSIYLLLIIPITIAGLVLVLLLFFLNLTVTDGTINAFILYVNIISINSVTFFSDYHSTLSYTFVSLANFDLGIQTCFYNGMDDYAKMWLQLAFPFYLIFIATLLIIGSRYSNRIQTITAHRALPVLATLFLLSYTKFLRIVSSVLFFYSSITHLPSKHTTHVWSIDANIPLFRVKFTVLFVVCLILFLVLVYFNFILLFTKTLSRFHFIIKFKPLLDAYQGPYKIKFYYWTGLQLMLRTICFGLSSLDSNINLTISIVILSITNVIHSYNKPFKNKLKNYQEMLFIINLQGLYTIALSFAQDDNVKRISVNVLIMMAAVQFVLIVAYHMFAYASNRAIKKSVVLVIHRVKGALAHWITRFHNKPQIHDQQFKLHHCDIPEVTHNYQEYREPLISQKYFK